ncbi:signal transduction histidine kinase [Planotetraspora thailandica]|uniref:histidine kinase n=1 Tax=Planotetraspora thailandica TaxID=487172 RepID=A0A8J3V1L4_9ACTN|nr:histidine kinase [Planotetraspora thailandica]GII53847.1 signal transduction histidine kinase [Planotetraspora thailandica]
MSVLAWMGLCAATGVLGFTFARGRACRGELAGEPTYLALHVAGLAAPSLRAGLTSGSARKAVRHLRTLLGTSALAITSADRVLAREGDGIPGDDRVLAEVAVVMAGGRPHVIAGEPGAVFVPLTVEGRMIGTLAAYDPEVGASLVRTATEVGRWVSGQLELAELDTSRRRTLEAEMRALRAQISPHFVYNSLTTIASFVRTDPERARELLLDFADFTRYALRRVRDFTTLADELSCVDRYLLLERARFGDRLRFTVQVAPEVLRVPVPFLCLQPLVENAIKHGMPGEVRVVIKDAGPEAHISVEDDGIGMDPEHVKAILDQDHKAGIGLSNVDLRMRHIYGHDYGLVVDTAPGEGTRIRLRVPKSRIAHDLL